MANRQAVLPTAAKPFLSVPPSDVVTQFQSGHGFTTSGADGSSNLNDTSNFVTGTQAATLVTAGAGATTFLLHKGLSAIDMTSKQYVVVIECDDPTHITTGTLCFMAGTGASSGTTYQWQLYTASDQPQNVIQAGRWTYYVLNFADATVNGSPVRSAITDYYVKLADDSTGNKVTVRVNAIYTLPNGGSLAPYARSFPSGAATICFDDGFSSQATLAKPVLDSNNLTASMFIIWDQIGLSGRLTQAQLLQFQDVAGWDINAHSMTDADHSTAFAALTAAELEANVTSQQQIMASQGFQGQGTAYPKGEVSTTAIGILRKYFQYARGTYNKVLETLPVADMFNLRAVSSISPLSGGFSPAAISQSNGLIDQTVAEKRWLILTFHKVIGNVTSVTNTTGSTYRVIYSSASPPYGTGASLTLAGFSPSGLNGTYTITNTGTTGGFGYCEVTIGGSPGNSTIQGTALSATTDCDLAAFTAIINKLVSSGVAVLTMADMMKSLYPEPSPLSLDAAAADIQPPGTAAAGSTGKAADAGHVHPAGPWQPQDISLLTANMTDTAAATNTNLTTAGTVYLHKLQIRRALTITNICFILTTAGSGVSTQSFAGLYSSAGTLLSGSSDIGSFLTGSTGLITLPLTTPQALSAGTFVWAAIVTNMGTTQPTLARSSASSSVLNAGLTAATFRWAVNGTSQTALPSPVTPASNSQSGLLAFWCGAS